MATKRKKKAAGVPAAWTKHIASSLRSLAVPIETLEPDPRNVREHGEENKRDVLANLARFGQQLPLIVCGSRVVVGNLRLEVARELGWKAVAVTSIDKAQADAFAIAENRAGERAEWNEGALAAMLTELGAHEDADLLASMGFTDDEMSKLLDQVTEGLDGLDLGFGDEPSAEPPAEPVPNDAEEPEPVVPEPPEEPITKLGDVIRLGDHILVCGDSLEDETWEVLDGKRVDLVLTDPPYAIYGSSTGIGADIADDKMVRPFFRSLGVRLAKLVKLYGHTYTFCDWRSLPALSDGYGRVLAYKNVIVWDKGGGGLGANYANTHEFIAFHHLTPRKTVMANAERQAGRPVHRPNIIRENRARGDERPHNASKPVALLKELIENSTEPGELVADPFGGGGSTLIAAEQTGRRAILSELEPAWCDVIVARWENLTGQTAQRPEPVETEQ